MHRMKPPRITWLTSSFSLSSAGSICVYFDLARAAGDVELPEGCGELLSLPRWRSSRFLMDWNILRPGMGSARWRWLLAFASKTPADRNAADRVLAHSN